MLGLLECGGGGEKRKSRGRKTWRECVKDDTDELDLHPECQNEQCSGIFIIIITLSTEVSERSNCRLVPY